MSDSEQSTDPVLIERISLTNPPLMTNSEQFICSQFASCLDNDHFYVSQYRHININFPKGFIVNREGQLIWNTLELEKTYSIVSSNITFDKNVLLNVRHEEYDLFEVTLDGRIVNAYNTKVHGLKNKYHYEKTKRNTVLISSADEGRVIELDNNNEIIFDYCPGKEILHEPRCVFLTECGHVLIADSKNHYILMVNDKKEIVWTYGEKNNPGFSDHRLMYPYMALELRNGNIILVEHQANRITEVTRDKNIVWYYGNSPIDETSSPRINHLNGPNYVQELPSGEVAVSDSMNGRVVVIDRAGKMVYSFGSSPKTHFILNYPRSVQVLKNQTFLISDSRNDRIVEMDRLGNILFEYGNEGNSPFSRMLKWPRCVLKDEDRNQYLISDGFNQRFIIIDQDKNVLEEIKEIVYESQAIPLWDPHSIEKVQGDQLLITDSGSNIVAIIDRSGFVSWMYNNENYLLDDPHYATLSQHNSIYIVDTNNNRILEVDLKSNRILNVIEYVYNKNNERIKLNKPKWIDIISDSEMAILDSQNNCLMVVSIRDAQHPVIMHITGPNICNSRWACRQGSSYIISDFWQHDLLKITFRS